MDFENAVLSGRLNDWFEAKCRMDLESSEVVDKFRNALERLIASNHPKNLDVRLDRYPEWAIELLFGFLCDARCRVRKLRLDFETWFRMRNALRAAKLLATPGSVRKLTLVNCGLPSGVGGHQGIQGKEARQNLLQFVATWNLERLSLFGEFEDDDLTVLAKSPIRRLEFHQGSRALQVKTLLEMKQLCRVRVGDTTWLDRSTWQSMRELRPTLNPSEHMLFEAGVLYHGQVSMDNKNFAQRDVENLLVAQFEEPGRSSVKFLECPRLKHLEFLMFPTTTLDDAKRFLLGSFPKLKTVIFAVSSRRSYLGVLTAIGSLPGNNRVSGRGHRIVPVVEISTIHEAFDPTPPFDLGLPSWTVLFWLYPYGDADSHTAHFVRLLRKNERADLSLPTGLWVVRMKDSDEEPPMRNLDALANALTGCEFLRHLKVDLDPVSAATDFLVKSSGNRFLQSLEIPLEQAKCLDWRKSFPSLRKLTLVDRVELESQLYTNLNQWIRTILDDHPTLCKLVLVQGHVVERSYYSLRTRYCRDCKTPPPKLTFPQSLTQMCRSRLQQFDALPLKSIEP